MVKGKLRSIKGGGKPPFLTEEQIQQQLEYFTIRARLQRHYYIALIAQGFEERLAIELCKSM